MVYFGIAAEKETFVEMQLTILHLPIISSDTWVHSLFESLQCSPKSTRGAKYFRNSEKYMLRNARVFST